MTVSLPEDDSEIFKVFVEFLYDGRIHSTRAGDEGPDADDADHVDPEWERLARCWILGDKLHCNWFQDASIDSIVQKIAETETVPKNLHALVYSQTSGDNPLKQLVVDIATWKYEKEDFNKDDSSSPDTAQFYRDIIARLHERCNMRESTTSPGPGEEPWNETGCEPYHFHNFYGPASCYDCAQILGGARW